MEIINDCLEHGIEGPEFDIILGGFKITFHAADQGGMSKLGSRKSSRKSSQKSLEKIINLMKENQEVTIAELARIIGISDRAIKKNISLLKLKGKIRRVGSDRAGHWEIIEE